jgi:PAS domain S-box-containing protein
VYDWDLRTNAVFRSEGLYELLGFHPEEVEGSTDWWYERVHPEDRNRPERGWKPALSDSFYVWEYRVRHRDGHYINVLDRAIVVRDAEGAPIRVVGTTSDVTEWKSAEAALKRSELRLQTMAETVPGILFTNDPDGACNYTNRRYYDYTGMPAGSAGGSNWLTAVHPEDTERVRKSWAQAIANGEPYSEEYRLRRHDGEYRWIKVLAVPVKESGVITSWFGTGVDIHDQKDAQQQLEQSTRELARSNEELQRFAYVISHDLQSPLRTIGAMTQLLHRRYYAGSDAEAGELVQQVQSGVERMTALINDLLDYSKLAWRSSGVADTTKSRAALDWAVANLRAQLEDAKAVIEVDGELPEVMADDQLGRVFQNLIGNSVKYRGDKPPVIRISAKRRRDEVLFAISDNGIGFDMEDSERVFGVFSRLPTTKRYEGTGIGLAICKRIIEGFGGRIWAESVRGEGATFYFTLPAAAGPR